MAQAEEFRKFAAQCWTLATTTHDRTSKDQWIRLAERWLLCARLAEHRELEQQTKPSH
jgi:hypothetical protein